MRIIAVLIMLIVFFQIVPGQSISKPKKQKAELLALLNRAADWQIANFSYAQEGNLHDYGIDAWTNSVFYIGLCHYQSISNKSTQYQEWLYHNIGEHNQWQIPANFKNYTPYRLFHADELCMGQFYTLMYRQNGEDKMIAQLKERLDWIISHDADTSMNYRNKQRWTWCDALFMAPVVYLRMASITNNQLLIHHMHDEFKATYEHLFDSQENLFFRDDSYLSKRESNGKKIFWGRGNGWVVAGLANILSELSDTDPERSFYIQLFKKMVTRLVELREQNGFWHASLLDPQSYPAPETSATAMITYAIAWGVNAEILDKKVFGNIALSSWKALSGVTSHSGRLGYVQPIGADPKKVTSEMTASYGVGAFLLAGTEIYKMIGKK